MPEFICHSLKNSPNWNEGRSSHVLCPYLHKLIHHLEFKAGHNENDDTSLCIRSWENQLSTPAFFQSDEQADQLLVYPNPVKNKIRIESECSCNFFELCDSPGKLLRREVVHSFLVEVDISGLNNGLYFLTVYDKNHQHHKKFMKE